MLRPMLTTLALAAALLTACAGQAAPAADPAEVALQATVVAVRAAVAAELGPEPSATPTRTRGAALLTAIAGPTPSPAADDAPCGLAAQSTARAAVETRVQQRLARDYRPSSPLAWSSGATTTPQAGRDCWVKVHFTLDGDPEVLMWLVNLTTGAVTPVGGIESWLGTPEHARGGPR